MAAPKSFAFVFPMASGHINPSFPVARALVNAGHHVHYLCRPQMRDAIEDTGAVFHSELEWESELWHGREESLCGTTALKVDYDLESASFIEALSKLTVLAMELQLPGLVRWLQHVGADAIMLCPIMCKDAIYAGKVLGIPSVSLLTTAGPGSIPPALEEFLLAAKCSEEELAHLLDTFQPHQEAVRRLNNKYDLELEARDLFQPFGFVPWLRHCASTLVTTLDELQDPLPVEMEQAYLENGTVFEPVGALLDKEGSRRAAGHKFRHAEDQSSDEKGACHSEEDAKAMTSAQILASVRDACNTGRAVVLVSLGTVITGDDESMGWAARPVGQNGGKRGLTGCELCRGAWGAAFDAFGRQTAEEGPLIVLALGPQPDALGPLTPPPNAICVPTMPQVDILKIGVKVFLTHGGQNSFTEALATGTPVVVCPGFGDQPVNARKAEALGVGLQVPRPDPELGAVAKACQLYRAEVAKELVDVFSQPSFGDAAAEYKAKMACVGGVPRAVEVMLCSARGETQSRPGAGVKAADRAYTSSVAVPQCGGA